MGLWPDEVPFPFTDGAGSPVLESLIDGPAAALTVVALVVAPGARASGWGARAAVELAARWRGTRRVVLADLDLEQPALHTAAQVQNDEGVIDMIEYGTSLGRLVQSPPGATYDFVPAGLFTPEPGVILRHDGWTRVLMEVAARRGTLLAWVPSDADGVEAVVERAGAVLVLAEPGEGRGVVEQLPHPYAVLAILTSEAAPAIPDSPEDLDDDVTAPAAVAPAVEIDPAAADAPVTGDVAPSARGAHASDSLASDPAAREDLAAELRDRQLAARLAGHPGVTGAGAAGTAAAGAAGTTAAAGVAGVTGVGTAGTTAIDAAGVRGVPRAADAPREDDVSGATATSRTDMETAASEATELEAAGSVTEPWAGPDDADAVAELDALDPGAGPADVESAAATEPDAGDVVTEPDAAAVASAAVAAERDAGDVVTEPDAAAVASAAVAADRDAAAATEPDAAAASERDADASASERDAADVVIERRAAEPSPAVVAAVPAPRPAGNRAMERQSSPPIRSRSMRPPRFSRPLLWTVGVALLASLLAGTWHFLGTRLAPPEPQVVAPVPDPVPPPSAPTVENALPFVVAIEAHRELPLALVRVTDLSEMEPELTFHVESLERDGTVFYHVMAGPVADSATAFALRDTLIARGHKTAATPTDVRATPLAFLIGDYGSAAAAEEQSEILRRLDIAGYVLESSAADGAPLYRLYVGGFGTETEADVAGQMLRAAGIRDSLVTRTGLTTAADPAGSTTAPDTLDPRTDSITQ